MSQLRTFLLKIHTHALFMLSVFLLVFIPLFPKIPLFDVLPGYIVRVRPEDFLVILTGLVWLRDIRKKRIIWNTSYFWFVVLYACVGLFSILFGIFLLKTIPFEGIHIGKSGLHFIRYLEYFSLFFFFFSSITTKRRLIVVYITLVLTVIGVVGYGIGQKYLHFPVYSTMNREYSKGEKLYLQEGARPQSTFAGHYDLAAFLVITLPLIFSLSLSTPKSWFLLARASLFIALQTVHLAGLGMLILTGSATALAGYALALGLVVFLHLLRLPTLKQRCMWGTVAILACVAGTLTMWTILPQRIKDKALNVVFGAQMNNDRPADLVGDGYEIKTIQVANDDGTFTTTTVRERNTWSPNALKYGLSMGIRLDTLWPQALSGLSYNPLTGSGYGTLAMLDTKKFMEADSTDNNFLRTLGETGILGFLTFYGIALFILKRLAKHIQGKDAFFATSAIGFIGAIVGLLITALYLDVFAASKVAFTFWALAGGIIRATSLTQTSSTQRLTWLAPFHRLREHFVKHWPLYTAAILSFFLLHQNPYMERTPLKDLNGATEGLKQLTAARCFLQKHTFELCRNNGLTLETYMSPYAFALVPLLSLFRVPGAFYYLNVILIFAALLPLYIPLRRVTNPKTTFFSLAMGALFTSLLRLTSAPLNHLQLGFVLIGIPLTVFMTYRTFQRPHVRIYVSTRRGILALCVGIFLFGFFGSNLFTRFRNVSANFAYYAVQLANTSLASKPNVPAYLITTLNPYYVDLYASNTYKLLPLSLSQPYAPSRTRVWDITDQSDLKTTYDTLLSTNANLFVSDYGVYSHATYTQDFLQIKKSYDLNYITLGCDERCNLYTLHPLQTPISQDPLSVFTSATLSTKNLTAPYEFTVVSSRFDPVLTPPQFSYIAPIFSARPFPLTETPSTFMIFTGDPISDTSSSSAQLFIDQFAKKAPYPMVYSGGNVDLLPNKYFDHGFQSFFTKTEYFIFLETDKDSRLSKDQQLRFYNALLQLEKLPDIKNVFIVSHDLNWQDTRDPLNATHILRRKLKEFSSLHVHVITANHNPRLAAQSQWFVSARAKKSNMTFYASLATGSENDTYLRVKVNPDGGVEVVGEGVGK